MKAGSKIQVPFNFPALACLLKQIRDRPSVEDNSKSHVEEVVWSSNR